MKKLFVALMLCGGIIALLVCSKDNPAISSKDNPAISPEAPNSTFPDANFRTALAKLGFVVTDDDIDTTNATNKNLFATTRQLNVSALEIASLKGIEYFTALTKLDCNHNQLTALDVSKNTALTSLVCGSNQLSALDVSKNTVLTLLRCDSNQLTALNVSKNTALTELYCINNQLTALDVSKNTALTGLGCSNNQENKTGLESQQSNKTLTLTLTTAQDAGTKQDDDANGRITKHVIP